MLNIVILVLFIFILAIYNLRLQFKRNNMGRIIVLGEHDMTNYFSLFISVAYLFNFYRVIKNFMYDADITKILMIIFMVIVALSQIYFAVKKKEIREEGIYTPIGICDWNNVISYELIDYRKYNKYYEGDKYLLKLKVKSFNIGTRKWYRSLEFDIKCEQKKMVEEFLTKVLWNKAV